MNTRINHSIQSPHEYLTEVTLIRPDTVFKATFCYCVAVFARDYEKMIQCLHPQERAYYRTLKFKKRIEDFLIGRYVAKTAVAGLTGEANLADIYIKYGIFSQPVVELRGHNIQVSITHCDRSGAAVAFPEAHPLGIDLEKINPAKPGLFRNQITAAERELIASSPEFRISGLTFLWTAKEALSKVLKTGLTTPFELFEISRIEPFRDCILAYFKNFAQYKVISFTIGRYMCSLVHPLKTDLQFDLRRFRTHLSGP